MKPPIEGIDSQRILTLRNIPDTDQIKAYVDNKTTKSAVVIGGGFVGVEMAENLKHRGLEVTIVEAAPHILAPFDSDIVGGLEQDLSDHGVKLILNDGVKSFKELENSVEINLSSGLALTADLVILAIGVIPDTGFLKDSGIKLGARGHIIVDQYLATNVENIYAVGDAIEVVACLLTKSTTSIASPTA